MMPSSIRHLPCRQRGIVTAMAAVILITVVMYVFYMSYDIIGDTSEANHAQDDSVAALMLAESGVERAKKILIGSPSSGSVCSGLSANSTDISLGRGTFSLTGVAGPTGCVSDCTNCIVTATGNVNGKERIIETTMTVSSGGASTGCGGGGTNSAGACPINDKSTGLPYTPYHDLIIQQITVDTADTPVILVANTAYQRHPKAGNSADNKIVATGCVTKTPSGTDTNCITQWSVQSTSGGSAGIDTVGSRGASVLIENPDTYFLNQSLSNDSLYAAISAVIKAYQDPVTKVKKPLKIIGSGNYRSSYWDDSTVGSGTSTKGTSATTGQTNNGTLCDSSSVTNCPNGTKPPETDLELELSSRQASDSWCYGADTLLFGLSGKTNSNNTHTQNGAVRSFRFGTSPASTLIDPGIVYFPKPQPGLVSSEVFATFHYLYNPDYLSPINSVSSGAKVTARAGVDGSLITASVTKNTNIFTLSNNLPGDYKIFVGDEVYCTANGPPCNKGLSIGIIKKLPCTTNSDLGCGESGAYELESTYTQNTVSSNLNVYSKKMLVASLATESGVPGWLSIGDKLLVGTNTSYLQNGSTEILIDSVPCTESSCQKVPDYYILSLPTLIYKATATGGYEDVSVNGYTLNVLNGTTPPSEGTMLASKTPDKGRITSTNTSFPVTDDRRYWRACVATNPKPEAHRFYLNQWDTTTNQCGTTRFNAPPPAVRLVGSQVCGGICAFFDHATNANTTFVLDLEYTKQWASGMICLSGVDKGSIKGLTGTNPSIRATSWHEKVRD